MRLYTVDRENSLKEGISLELTKTSPYDLPYYLFEGLTTHEQLTAHTEKLFPNGLSHHGHKYLKGRHTYGTHPNYDINDNVLTEMTFEYTRRLDFPHLPSRFQSMFASDTIETAKWFRKNYGAPQHLIYEIEATNFLKVDMNLLYSGVQNVAGSFFAHQYWTGKSSQNPYWEYIVELPVKVISIVPEL
jgi:hypothetical protein